MTNLPGALSDVPTAHAEQYSLAKILGIWCLAAVPMGIIVHSAQSVFFAFLILGIVLGFA